jgi:tRNA U38,U39,U40 pseudouridine synthase TruA
LVWGNFIQQDLRSATVVGIFLSSRANSRLEEKFSQELRPGTRIVSYYWPMKKWNPKFVDYENRIYLYQVPEEFSATD